MYLLVFLYQSFSYQVVYPRFETRNSESGIEIERLFLYPKENASNHHTDKYDLATEQDVSVLRRSGNFYLAIHAKSRPFDLNRKDRVNLVFEFGNKYFRQTLEKDYFHNIFHIKLETR